MEASEWRQRGSSFGSAADLYDRIRPGYPVEALRWLLEGRTCARVVDLGAGTGILTRQLLALGHEVIPVEPDPDMRARLAAVTPGSAAVPGSAEAIPLPDASVDAVLAGQAYHWFDTPKANAEIARVLRVGGVVGLLWNDRDESVPWLAGLSRIANGLADRNPSPRAEEEALERDFDDVVKAVFRHATEHDADSLVDLVKSRSYYLTLAADRRDAVVRAVRALAGTLPERFEMPYVTHAYRGHQRG